MRIPVLIGFYLLWLKLKKTGFDQIFSVQFGPSLVRNQLRGCWLPIFGAKNWIRPDLQTLFMTLAKHLPLSRVVGYCFTTYFDILQFPFFPPSIMLFDY